MRLVDADKLIEDIKEYVENIKTIRDDGKCFLTEENVLSIIEEEPVAFDVDKVMEQLEELRDKANLDMLKNMNEPIPYSSTSNRMFAYDKAIEVVKAGGIDNVHK